MTENVTKRIIHISNFFLLLSLCALIVLSFIDVLPSKQSSFERLFYSCAAVFVISLCVDFCLILLRFHGSNVMKLNKQFVVALLVFSTGFITGIFCALKGFEHKVARQPEECCDCKEALTAAAIDTILIQVNAHELSNGTLPKIEQITPPFCTGRFQGGITDAYGHKMHCEIINGLFKVRSAGADGVFGTDDDITGVNRSGTNVEREVESFKFSSSVQTEI